MESHLLLSSELPEVFMLALLGRYDGNNLEKILKLILNKLASIDRSAKEKAKYLHQILILSRLRRLEPIAKELIEAMPVFLDHPIEEDFFSRIQ